MLSSWVWFSKYMVDLDLLVAANFVEAMREAGMQELIDADSDAAVDRAVRKVKLLCYD